MACLCYSAYLSVDRYTVFVLIMPFSFGISFVRIPCVDLGYIKE